MSKKFGSDRINKLDKNLKNYEESEYYYSDSDEDKQENDNNESKEHTRD